MKQFNPFARIAGVLLILTCLLVPNITSAQVMREKSKKFLNRLYEETVFGNLKKDMEEIQGTDKGVIPAFLEYTERYPENIPPDKFQEFQQRYARLVKKYNGLIDKMIQYVEGIEKLRELKHINFKQFQPELESILEEFSDLFVEIGNLNKSQPSPLLTKILIDIGRGIFDYFKEAAIESLKQAMIRELENLKLSEIDWEPTEEKLMAFHKKGITPTGITPKSEFSALPDQYKIIGVSYKTPLAQVEAAHQSKKAMLSKLADAEQMEDVKGYYEDEIDRLDFALNKIKAQYETPNKGGNTGGGGGGGTPNADCKQQEMKGAIKGAILITEGGTREELIEALEKVLSKY